MLCMGSSGLEIDAPRADIRMASMITMNARAAITRADERRNVFMMNGTLGNFGLRAGAPCGEGAGA